MSKMVTVIGRGHSGTRALSQTLSESGVFMGEPLNASGDLLPPEPMYEACRLFAEYVDWNGGVSWDWNRAQSSDIPEKFIDLISEYLKSIDTSSAEYKGWKIPETTLVFPWIARLFPDIMYVFWVRNPRDCILSGHVTDDLTRFGISYEPTEDIRRRRAISWRYQHDLVRAAPRPRNWIEVRFEDFVLRQEETLTILEEFLEMPLTRIEVRPDRVDAWENDSDNSYFDILRPGMVEHNYAIPMNTNSLAHHTP